MYILANGQIQASRYLTYLPPSLRDAVSASPQDGLCEIRIRRSRPVMLYYTDGSFYLAAGGGRTQTASEAYIVGARELLRACELIFEFSLYAHEDELSCGFVTIRGGHRIGIAGDVRDGKLRKLSDITSLNYRIAHEHVGISEPILPKIIKEGRILNTLIVSPPMCGKTSLLRDIIRAASVQGIKVGVCDTRGELAAVYDGEPNMDIGNADIISGAPKAVGMTMLLRCMSPDVIVCDELGGADEAAAAKQIFGCGVSLISTAHSSGSAEVFTRREIAPLKDNFECIVTLGGIGEIREVYYA